MNTKLLASIAVFALLSGVVGTSMMHSVYASDYGMADKKMADKKAKIDTKMTDKKAKADAKAADAKAKADKKAADAKAKADKKAADAKAKADKKAADAKAKADKKAADAKAKMDAKKTNVKSGAAASDVTVEIPKGVASDQNCADKCFAPNTITVAVGGKVTWKNDDSAAHTATANDGSFDTSMIMAGASASNTFKTAGSYPYMCIVHPWMQGTVVVQ